MVSFNATDPMNANLKSAEVIRAIGRLLVNDGTTNTLETTDAANICVGVSAGESSRDAAGTLETSSATVAFFPVGGVLYVQSAVSATYTTGCLVYAGADGLATATSASNKVIGIYVGEGDVTGGALLATANSTSLTEGVLIPVNTAGCATA